ncbi:MAG: PorT family protein [Cyclobacteriaceae bacterium]|nr:PorT family protein [Cyclobacteriaceae bacterium]
MRRLLPIVLILVSFCGFAQTSPTPAQTLRLARATYEQGRLHEIPTQLSPQVISSMTSKQDKVEAYKILCLSYIYLEEPEKADEAMLNILRTDPYFEINEAVDPAEFVALYHTFRTLPIFRIGGKLGVDASRPNVKENATAGDLAGESKYKPMIGINFGVFGDVPLSERLNLHGEILYSQKRFGLNQVFTRFNEDGSSDANFQNETDAIESQTWLSVPLAVQYKPLKSKSKFNEKFNPYVSGGVAIDYLLSAKITGEQVRDQQSSVQEKSFDFKPSRNSMNISLMAAIGIKLRVGGGYIVSEIRYLHGLTKISSKESAYKNQEITWELNYADPVFKVSSLGISAGYIQNIFNPKKLKRRK